MTLESLALLPELQKIPIDASAVDLDFRGRLTRIAELDRDHWSIEFSSGVERSLLALFEARNVPDVVREAYGQAFSNSAIGLHERYLEMVGRGEQSATGFLSNLKGRVAELKISPDLEERYAGYKFDLASNPNQPIWDIRGVGPEGTEDIFVQVKFGSASYAREVIERMEDAPSNVTFAVSSEIYEKITESIPELSGRLIDSGISNLELSANVREGLEILAQNQGIDVPDSVGEILPYIGEIVLAIKLIADIVSVERDFKEVSISDRSRVHALKALTLMSRFGITSVCVSLGGTAGSIALPGVGTAGGAIGGAGLAFYLNRRLKPRMLEVAMKIAGVDEDDMFYLRNKVSIDRVGASLAATRAA